MLSFIRKRWIRVFVTIPVTLAVSAVLVYNLKDYSSFEQGDTLDRISIISVRAKEITQSNERLDYWPAAIKLFSENPIYGGGGDSFGWQYKEYFNKPDGKYHDDPDNKIQLGKFGTAHNLYLQILAGKGFFGLLFLLGFLFILFYKLVLKKFLARNVLSVKESIIVLVILGALIASLIYANVQEIFYTQPVAIIFWLVVFMGASLVHIYSTCYKSQKDFYNLFKYVSVFLLLLLPFHLLNISYVSEFISTYLQSLFPSLGSSASQWLVFGSIWVSLLAFIISYWLHHRVIFHTHKIGCLIDDHQGDKVHIFHEQSTPRAGGIGLFFANVFLIFNPLGWLFLVSSLPAFFAGIVDDFSSLTPRTRLFFQLASAILAAWLLQASVYSFGFEIDMPVLLAYVISVVAIVGMINAINIIDVFNGLAGGVVLMILLSLGVVSWQVNDMAPFEIIVVNSAALIGFLTINFPKGKIFLGDGGAYFLGFMSISLAMMLTQQWGQISQWYVLALVIYPVFEVLFSIYRRKFIKNMKTTA
ncbi:MAG: O-antigen ligase family protein, partial [Thiotrichaceae bacterium]|nr:O-antigen ligase family protein [Thiotrichaceae bacterium]